MNDIKPIETSYKGYLFRSRLEARWAVFLDAIGAEWEYEPEGFMLPNGLHYLPDFKVKFTSGRKLIEKNEYIWLEVKGQITEIDKEKISLFSKAEPILIVGNIPDPDNWYWEICDKSNEAGWFFDLEFVDGDFFPGVPCAAIGGGFHLNDGNDNFPEYDKERTTDAYRKARRARFEHGETPS